jgi:hypothetical protein
VKQIMKLPMLTADAKLAEIKRLYFGATRHTVQADLDKALDLLKSMESEDERARATVYMHGLNEMRRDWGGKKRKVRSQKSEVRSKKSEL